MVVRWWWWSTMARQCHGATIVGHGNPMAQDKGTHDLKAICTHDAIGKDYLSEPLDVSCTAHYVPL